MWVLPTSVPTDTPLALLREQGAHLAGATSGRLQGRASCSGVDDTLIDRLDIEVPSLNRFRLLILEYARPLTTPYPGRLTSRLADVIAEVADEEAFLASLKDVLSSNGVADAVGTLLAIAIEADA